MTLFVSATEEEVQCYRCGKGNLRYRPSERVFSDLLCAMNYALPSFGQPVRIGYRKPDIAVASRNPREARFPLSHQSHKPASTGHLQLTKDRVQMFFHHLQAQASLIGDLLIAAAFASQSRHFLLA
jgi:hypothetical protein